MKKPKAANLLEIMLVDYLIGCALMGAAAAQSEEPDKEWLTDWAIEVGELMARKVRARRRLPEGVA